MLKVKTVAGTKLKAVAAHLKVLDVVVGSADGEGLVTVALSVGKEVRYGRFEGEIRLEFTGEETGTLTVPFAGYAVEKAAQQ